jgi:hypothetical protein
VGTWGPGLYENDSTCDVRDSYMRFLREGLDDQDAHEKTLEEFREYIGDQDESLLWFALAETQWSVGRLTSEVKEKALDWIEKKGGLELWLEEEKKEESGKKHLRN